MDKLPNILYIKFGLFQSMQKLISYHRKLWLIISNVLPVMTKFYPSHWSLNLEQNFTKVTCHCDR